MAPVFNADLLALCFWHADGRILDANPLFLKMLGYTQEDLSAGALTADSIEPAEARERDVVGTAGPARERRLLRKDGSRIPVLVGSAFLPGTRERGISYFIDISGNEKGELALERESRFVRLMQAISTAANEATRVEDVIQFALDQICAHLNWPVGHAYLRGKDGKLIPMSIWHLEDKNRFQGFRDYTESEFSFMTGIPGRALRMATPIWEPDFVFMTEFPRSVPAWTAGLHSALAFPVFAGKEAVAVLEFFSSVRAAPDEKLLGVLGQIGIQIGRVIERKRSEEELISARQAALDASEAKSKLLANTSHEIRTPINAIIGLTSFLLNTRLTPSQKRYAQALRQSGTALLHVINDILDFSKIESGRIDLEDIDFNLHQLIDDCVKLFAYTSKRKRIQIGCQIAKGVPSNLRGDHARLRQVLTNLLGNAVKFTPKGKVTVKVTAEEVSLADAKLRIEVIDTGIGIPKQAHEKIFEPFAQADSSMTRRFGGTGLGLSISKRLVELMRGSIGVISAPGKGSTFWFTVSLQRTASPISIPSQHKKKSPASRSASRHILLVEDNALNQIVAVTLIEKFGHTAHAVSNGLDALRELETHPYDLVLMDCQMPDLDGYETSERIRQHPKESIRNLPIVAMTANAITGDREKCLEAGMDDYLPKPVDPERLSYMIDKWTQGPIDLTVLEKLRSFESPNKPGVLKRVIEVFFSSTPIRFEKMDKAFAEQDLTALAREAHNLKNSTAQVGAYRMTPICLQLEEINAARFQEARQLISQLKREYALVKLTLEKQIDLHKQVA